MTHSERFRRIFQFEPVDRMPVYFFGSWPDTKRRWIAEGLTGPIDPWADAGPQLPGMDPDWEDGLWANHGLCALEPLGDIEPAVLEERERARVVRTAIGKVELVRTDGTSISHTLKYPLQPTRESWRKFIRFLDPHDPRRVPKDIAAIAASLNARDAVNCLFGGSFYGWLRDFMGVEQLSYMMYDDPALLEEMLDTLTEYFITALGPALDLCRFDFVYISEDCCGSNGPLFSPKCYRALFDRYYRRLLEHFKSRGVPLALIDSDGLTDPLVPCWLDSGFDIIFPLEVGIWQASPRALRKKFGARTCIMGGVDKRLIPGPEAVLRAHLLSLRDEVEKGGFLPMPDHRIPPDVSLEQMRRYIRVFREVFGICEAPDV